MRFLYEVVFFIFSLFYLPSFFIKGKWGRASGSRLGIIPKDITESPDDIHHYTEMMAQGLHLSDEKAAQYLENR